MLRLRAILTEDFHLGLEVSILRVLVTSRPYMSIETVLFQKLESNKVNVHLAADDAVEKASIKHEIDVFIESRIQQFHHLRESKGIHDDSHEILQKHLAGIENSTYIWVAAIFSQLDKAAGAPRRKLLEIIRILPEDVESAYQSILEQCLDIQELVKILHMILVAERPLYLMELNAALSVDEEIHPGDEGGLLDQESFSKWVRDVCGFFISVIDVEIYLVHQSARDFLLKSTHPPKQISINLPRATHLVDGPTFSGFDSISSRKWKHAFDVNDSHTVFA